MNQLEKLDAAYIAGFLDGDGSIYVRVKPNATYKFGFQIAPNIVFFQSQKGIKILEELKELIGGGYIRFRKDGIAEYIIGDMITLQNLVKQIRPYLRLKKLQAELLIQILDQKSRVVTQEDFLSLVKLIDSFLTLNYSKKRKNGFTSVKTLLEQKL